MIPEHLPEHVVGYVFNPDRSRVLMIKKNRPKCLDGKWNGLGGRVEPDETPLNAMVRELAEESGLHVPQPWWYYFARMDRPDGSPLHFFRSDYHDLEEAKSLTDETVTTWKCQDICALPPSRVCTPWLIQIARYRVRQSLTVFPVQPV